MSARGRRLGVDVGAVRVGVALSDPDGVLATPLVTVPRDLEHGTDVAALRALVAEHEAVEVVVGLPRTSGGPGRPRRGGRQGIRRRPRRRAPRARRVRRRAADHRGRHPAAPLTGCEGRKQRAVIDQAAAVAILQGWLDARR